MLNPLRSLALVAGLILAGVVVLAAASPCAVIIEPPRISHLEANSFWAHLTPPADFDGTTHYQLNINGALYGGSTLWPDIHVKGVEPGRVGYVKAVVYQRGMLLGVSTATVVLTPPAAALGVAAFDVGTASFRLRWNAVDTALGYKVFRDLDFLVADVPASPTWTIIGGLMAGQTYGFSVKAYNSSGDGLRSDSITVTMKPLPVINLRATDIGTSAFTLAWDPVFGAASYAIEVQSALIATVPHTVTEYRIGSQTAGATSTVRLFAINAGGTSSPSLPLAVLLRPPAPLRLWATEVSSYSFVLNWTPVPDVTRYRVYRDYGWCVANVPASQTAVRCGTWVNPGELATMTVLAVNPSGDSDHSPYLVVNPATVSRGLAMGSAVHATRTGGVFWCVSEDGPREDTHGVNTHAALARARVGDDLGACRIALPAGGSTTVARVAGGRAAILAVVGSPAERVIVDRLAADPELAAVCWIVIGGPDGHGAWILDGTARLRGREPLVQPDLSARRILQLLGDLLPARGPLGQTLERDRHRFDRLHQGRP